MRVWVLLIGTMLLGAGAAFAAGEAVPAPVTPDAGGGNSHIEVTADQSLEWYQDKHLYVARGDAKAVRGNLTVEADTLTAHEREKPQAAPGAAAPKTETKSDGKSDTKSEDRTGDIDTMTADGNVRITTPKALVTGTHALYDMDRHVAFVTGDNLSYTGGGEKVTATDGLEYWEDKKLAVARGHAVAVKGDRHVEGDVLMAQFRDMPNGQTQMQTMTAEGHVTVITKSDVSRGDKAVFDAARNIAVLSGHVRITRADGTQLAGDVGEVDFQSGRSRLMNEGSGRVSALLATHTGAAKPKQTAAGMP